MTVAQGQAQAAVVQHQATQGQGSANAVEQMIAGERFLQEVVRASAHGLHGERYITVTGDQQHRQLWVLGVQLAQ